MSGTKKTKATSAPAAQEARDEIDQIMSEIEQLQQEIDSGTAATSGTSKPSVVSAIPETDPQAEADAAVAEASAVAETQAMAGAEAEAPDDDALSEFRASAGDEASLDDLSDLKDDGQGGSGLLDQVDALHEEVIAETAAPEQAGYDDQELEHIASFGSLSGSMTEPAPSIENGVIARQESAMENKKTGGSIGGATEQSSVSANEGSLTMNLTGNMSLKLRYEYEGQEVTIGFVDQYLQVTLADGTEFRVPVGRSRQLRRVA